jgi:hypothetical protein
MMDGIPMPPPHPEHHNRDGCATFNPHAIPSIEAAALQIFRVFRAFRGQKMGCGRQPTPSLFVYFVVKKF